MSTSKTDKSIPLSTAEPVTRRRLYKVIRSLPEGHYSITVVKKRDRPSDGQRGYYWGYLIPEAARLLQQDRETTDRLFSSLFLLSAIKVGEESLPFARSSSDLDPMEAATYFRKIRDWARIKFNARLMAPDSELRKEKPVTN